MDLNIGAKIHHQFYKYMQISFVRKFIDTLSYMFSHEIIPIKKCFNVLNLGNNNVF
jgi:hypothetical protein